MTTKTPLNKPIPMNPPNNNENYESYSQSHTFCPQSQQQSTTDQTQFGHSITTKSPTSLRLLLQNPNGINSDDECFEFKLYMEQMKALDVDIIALSETNINWKDYSVYKHTTTHRKTTFVHSHHIPACSTKSFDTPYQPGGCSITLCEHSTGRYHSSITDPLGRWSIVHLNTSFTAPVTIICVYQVCNTNITQVGPKTAYSQQWSILRDNGYLQPNPRRMFIKDLDNLISSFHSKNHKIILCGDFNESIGDSTNGLDYIITKYNLSDAIQHQHGPYNISTYFRGNKCLDYIFVSSNVLPAIQQSAIMPFNYVISSDHRPIYIDLNTQLLFGKPMSPLMSPPTRVLRSTNAKQTSQYIAVLHKSMEHHNIFDRTRDLMSNPVPNHQLAESIDRDMTRLMIAAEKKLKRPSPYPFSSKLLQACLSVTILKTHLNATKRHKNKQHIIQTLQSKMKSPIQLPNDIPSINALLREARKKVREIRKDAMAARFQFLSELCETSPNSKIIRRIQKAEELKYIYSKIKHLIKPSSNSLITHLLVPNDNLPPKLSKDWNTITDPTQVNQLLFDRNTKHFGSAYGTPFTVPPLCESFNWTATSLHATNTLDGQPPHNPSDLIRRLLAHLKRPTTPTIATITMQQFIRRLRRWRESTSTSPSRRHLGHYKCLLPHHSEQMDKFKGTQAYQILHVHLDLLNYCARHGYSFHRWQKIVTTMIPKEQDNFKIHRLRVIHLYEADLTALFSLWSRRMITQSEHHKRLHPGSYGARPGRTSTDPPFISTLQIETAHLSRTSLVNIPNDASQCYDRIVSNLAMISCISHHMSPSAAKCIGTTLKLARYHLKTSLAETDTYWQHSSTTPIYGTGQGSGISPGICCVLFSDLFQCHSKISPVSTYACPTGTVKSTIENVGFVDDTTTTTNDLCSPNPIPTDQLSRLGQTSLQNWNDYVFISGGDLELQKTNLFHLSWKFGSNGRPYPADNTQQSINIQNYSRTMTTTIRTEHSSTPYKVLGFYVTMDQNNTKQFEVHLEKCLRLSRAIAGSSLNRRESLVAYFAVYQPAVSYVLNLSTFTPKQCHQLTSQPTRLFLQKCGFSSTMHRAIVFGSRNSGGLGFRHAYIEQGIGHVLKIIQSLRSNGQSKNLLLITIHWLQVNAGVGFNLLQYPHRACPHLEGTWLRNTRDFLNYIHGSIRISHSFLPSPYRVGDKFIMDRIIAKTNYGRNRLQRINYCRLYLKVTFISELTTADGTKLLPYFWLGNVDKRASPPFQQYPRQDRPDSSSWLLWRRALRLAFCEPRKTTLRRPLGDWIRADHGRFHSITKNPLRLWSIKADRCEYYPISSHQISHLCFASSPTESTPPRETTPIDVISTGRRIRTTLPPQLSVVPSLPVPTTLQSLIQSLQGFQRRLLAGLTFHTTVNAILSLLHTPNPAILAATDGGSKLTTASFGWTLRQNSTDLISCSGPVDGLSLSSFRAECYGFTSFVFFLSMLHRIHPLPPSSLTVHLDSESLIKRIKRHLSSSYTTPGEATSCDQDILLIVYNYLSLLPISLHLQHVKSHQDRNRPLISLTIPAQANVAADRLATQALQMYPSQAITPLHSNSVCQLDIQGHTITSAYAYHIRHLAYDSTLRDHIVRRYKWSNSDAIDWAVLASFSQTKLAPITFTVKFIHSLLPTGKIAHRNDSNASPECPACGEFETNDHFLLCNHCSRRHFKIQLISHVRKHKSCRQTDPVLASILCDGLSAALTATPFDTTQYSSTYRLLCDQQSTIGWLNLLRGFSSPEWRRLHQRFVLQHDPTSPSSSIGPLAAVRTGWTIITSWWEFRNTQRHDLLDVERNNELERRANLTIRNLYSLKDSVLPTDRRLFHVPLQTRLNHMLSTKLAWIASHSTHLQTSLQQATAQNLHHMHPITSYFQQNT